MTERRETVLTQMEAIQDELQQELVAQAVAIGPELISKARHFEREVVAQHRQFRKGVVQYLKDSSLAHRLVTPVIYSMIFPIILLDVWITLYQHICFRAYGIPRVARRDFIIFDHHRLGYLNWVEAMNCLYCSYANGVFGYAREIASRTEQYWCPIKHAERLLDPHHRYARFLAYGDAEGYRRELENYRRAVRGVPRRRA